jgi:hypothetical protein
MRKTQYIPGTDAATSRGGCQGSCREGVSRCTCTNDTRDMLHGSEAEWQRNKAHRSHLCYTLRPLRFNHDPDDAQEVSGSGQRVLDALVDYSQMGPWLLFFVGQQSEYPFILSTPATVASSANTISVSTHRRAVIVTQKHQTLLIGFRLDTDTRTSLQKDTQSSRAKIDSLAEDGAHTWTT